MNRFSVFILLLAVILSSVDAASASLIPVYIGDFDCDPGGTVTVPILLSGIENYGTGTINIEYDHTVVEVTKVASSSDSIVTSKNTNNDAGVTSISAWNINGVSGDIVFANVNFTAVGAGTTTLNLIVNTLQDTGYTELPVTVDNGSISIASPQPKKPFLITGYVSDSNGDPCNDPAVYVTNTNTGVSWYAANSSTSNCYRLVLDSDEVNAGEMLHFDATDGTSTNSTEHTITTDEVNTGGFFDFNLTFESTGDPPPSIITYTITNTTISPDGDGIMDDTAIDLEFSETVAATIKIENASGVVRSLYTSSSVKNPNPKTWDGTDDDGNLVAAGTYHVNITMDDGVNPVVFDNMRSISVTDGTTVTVSIADITTNLGDAITLPIMLSGIQNYGTGTIKLAYNPLVVHVTDVTRSSDSTVVAKKIDNTTGLVNISAWNTDGMNGDIAFANVIFDAVGSGSTPLTLTVETLKDTSYQQIPVTMIDDGSITVADTSVAVISIGDGAGNVTVPITIEGGANVGSAHINITYNASVVNVTNVTGGDFDIIVTNLEHVHEGWVQIGAFQTDNPGLNGTIILTNVTFGSNSTNGTSLLNLSVTTFKDATPHCNKIPYIVQNGTYTVVLNGDVNGDGEVDIADAMYLAKHVIGITGFEEIIVWAADVNGDGEVDIADAMYLAKHILGKSGFDELR